jgi:hypothetical protein
MRTSKRPKDSQKTMYDAEELTRRSLRHILADNDLIRVFNGTDKNREAYLDERIFSI